VDLNIDYCNDYCTVVEPLVQLWTLSYTCKQQAHTGFYMVDGCQKKGNPLNADVCVESWNKELIINGEE